MAGQWLYCSFLFCKLHLYTSLSATFSSFSHLKDEALNSATSDYGPLLWKEPREGDILRQLRECGLCRGAMLHQLSTLTIKRQNCFPASSAFLHLCPSPGSHSLHCSGNLRPQPHWSEHWAKTKQEATSAQRTCSLTGRGQDAAGAKGVPDSCTYAEKLSPQTSRITDWWLHVLHQPSGQSPLDTNWGCQPPFVVNCESSPRHPLYCLKNHACFLMSDCGAMSSSCFQVFLGYRRSRSMGTVLFF